MQKCSFTYSAGGLGFEPRYSPPKGDVLPLDDPPALYIKIKEHFCISEGAKKGSLAYH